MTPLPYEHSFQLRMCFDLLIGPVDTALERTQELRESVAKCRSYLDAGVACEEPQTPRFAIKAYLERAGNWTLAPDGTDSGLKSLFHDYVAAGLIDIDWADFFKIGVSTGQFICPLQAAVCKGRIELVACLVEAGVDESCLHYTLGSQGRRMTLEEVIASLPAFKTRSAEALAVLSEARMQRRLSLEAASQDGLSPTAPAPSRRRAPL